MVDLSLSTNQNLDIVCDTSPGKYIQPCHVTLFIQIPTFNRRIVLQEPIMSWTVSKAELSSQQTARPDRIMQTRSLTLCIGCGCFGRRVFYFCPILKLDLIRSGHGNLRFNIIQCLEGLSDERILLGAERCGRSPENFYLLFFLFRVMSLPLKCSLPLTTLCFLRSVLYLMIQAPKFLFSVVQAVWCRAK